jgi:hypothetical protein
MNLTTLFVQFMKLLQKLKISADITAKAVLAAGLVIVISSMFPRGESLEMEFRIGAIWAQKDLIAPFSFPVMREEKEYQRDVDDAKRKVFQVFERDSTVNERQARRLEDFFRHVGEVLGVNRRYHKELKHGDPAASQDSLLLAQLTTALEIPFSSDEWRVLDELGAHNRLASMQRILGDGISTVYATGVLDRGKGTIAESEIALRHGKVEELVPVAQLFDHTEAVAALESRLLQHYRSDNDTMALAYKIGVIHLAPNIKFSDDATA